jgi:glycosyltransferase involved in cell wall biosynthesis
MLSALRRRVLPIDEALSTKMSLHPSIERSADRAPTGNAPSTRRIFFDGLNLGLGQGTGIATYTRMLAGTAHDLGYAVGVVYSTAGTPPRDPLLREIAFYDEHRRVGRQAKKMTATRLLHHVADQLRCHLSVKPVPVPSSGAVVARQFADTSPPIDERFVSRNLFRNARSYFRRTGAFVDLAFDSRPDVFHCTYPLPLRVKSACNLCTIHDLVPLRLPFATFDDKGLMFRLLKRIAAEADHIVTVSENSKRDIVDLLGVDENRITNTYQTVDFPRGSLEEDDDVVANRLDCLFALGFRDYLLFFGALEPKKNVARLIEAYFAAKVATPLVLVLSGGWQNQTEAALLARYAEAEPARKAGGPSIRRLDYVDFSTLITLIRGAQAVVFPSLYEGFGLPVLEAMTLGTPIVTSRLASLPEIAGDAAILVDPYDAEDIARGITTIAADADLRADLSRRGRAQAANFSPERYRERIAALYAKLS